MTGEPGAVGPRPLGEIASYHAHIYYDPATTRAEAEQLRIWIGEPVEWVIEVKMARFRGNNGKPDDTTVTAAWRDGGAQRQQAFRLGELRGRLVVETPGQKVAYVVDALFSKANVAARTRHAAAARIGMSLRLGRARRLSSSAAAVFMAVPNESASSTRARHCSHTSKCSSTRAVSSAEVFPKEYLSSSSGSM